MKESKNENESNPIAVPYIVHESEVSRLERIIVRLWISVIVLIVLLAASNAAWIWYESQWEVVESTEVTQENEGGTNNFIGGDGDITNGKADSEENTDETTQDGRQ